MDALVARVEVRGCHGFSSADCDTFQVLKEMFALLETGIKSVAVLRQYGRGANVLPKEWLDCSVFEVRTVTQ